MKLRLCGRSLRLRLTRSEVAELAKTGQVEEASRWDRLPPNSWFTACGFPPAHEEMTAEFVERKIIVQLPSEAGQRWASGDEVGIYSERPWGLRLMIGKDFKCLEARPHEDDRDAFEHPAGGAGVDCSVTA
jgi:uncharacterized protein DUF7009